LKLNSFSTRPAAETGRRQNLGAGAAVEDHPFKKAEEIAAVDPVEGIAQRKAHFCTRGLRCGEFLAGPS